MILEVALSDGPDRADEVQERTGVSLSRLLIRCVDQTRTCAYSGARVQETQGELSR
jgi:hypothetical protein